jgi:hypothetical protein
MAAGRLTVEDGGIPRTDPFSHTLQNRPWTNFEWLFQAGVYEAWRNVAFKGLIVLKALGLLLQILLLGRLCAGHGVPFLGRILGLGVWIYFLRYRDYLRPELVTLLGLVLSLLLVERIRRTRKTYWAATALLFAAWANSHGGFVLGLALLGFYGLGSLLQPGAADRRPAFLAFLKHGGIAVAGCLVNPYGWKILTFPFEHMAMLAPHRGQPWEVGEWKAPTWSEYELFWCWLALVALIFLASQVRRKRPDMVDALVLLAFGAAAVRYVRNIHPFVLVTVPIVLKHAVLLGAGLPARGKVSPPGIGLRRASHAAYAAALIFLAAHAVRAYQNTFRPKIVTRDYPVGACRFIGQVRMPGQVYNPYSWGGYFSWTLYPDHQNFMDSRYLFQDILKEDFEARSSSSAWTSFLNKYGVTYALTGYPKGFTAVKRPPAMTDPRPVLRSELMTLFPPQDWALVYWDQTALVFARRVPLNRSVIEQHEYAHFRPDDYLFMELSIRRGLLPRQAVLADLQRNRSQAGNHPAVRFFLDYFQP